VGRKLLLCLILTIGISGCSTFVDYPIGVPDRPGLIPITAEQQSRTPLEVLDACASNQATLKNHVKRLESRIATHDDSL
jgi:hypothetical protein